MCVAADLSMSNHCALVVNFRNLFGELISNIKSGNYFNSIKFTLKVVEPVLIARSKLYFEM